MPRDIPASAGPVGFSATGRLRVSERTPTARLAGRIILRITVLAALLTWAAGLFVGLSQGTEVAMEGGAFYLTMSGAALTGLTAWIWALQRLWVSPLRRGAKLLGSGLATVCSYGLFVGMALIAVLALGIELPAE